ncbi:SH3 domain-containing protein [Ancylobacter amanitiformis]|uniref:Uncharacterized protein YraI n=1 Tax=Ancylobacter amanitiformis TaxID=217069 RepID=A0ABU0LKY6_9HYPH|nr:SH3 domain-containing protein [Ancylobacter amanitiformis]MDQ0509325.1 uncharacterized protein YraI [Ancylobacter amanitiformis]
MRFTTSFARVSRFALAGTLAAGTIAVGTPAAFAAPATMARTAELRGGPGANYAMLGTLAAGTPIDVISCAGAWCRTQYGYVSAGAVLQGAPALPPSMAVRGVSGAATLGYAPGTAAAPVLAAGAGGASDNAAMAGPRTTIGTANVRSGPGTDYDITRTLPDATKVEVTGCANGWCQTSEGYISLYVLSRGAVAQVLPPQAQPPQALSPQTQPPTSAYGAPAIPANATVTRRATVRSGPGGRYGVLGTLPEGFPVSVVSCAGSWCQTQYGYVSARQIAQGAPGLGAPATAAASPARAITALPSTALVPASAVPAASGAAALGYAPGVAAGAAVTAGAGDAVDNAAMAGPRTTIGTANVRSGPGTDYDITRTLPDATKVEVTGCANGWCHTSEGYISLYVLSRGAVAQVLPPQALSLQAQPPQTVSPQTVSPQTLSPQTLSPQALAPQSLPNMSPGVAPGPAAASAATTASVKARSGPGVRFGVLGTLPAGLPVNIESCAGAWCRTQYGYVSVRHVAASATRDPPAPAIGTAPMAQATAAAPAGRAYAPGIGTASALPASRVSLSRAPVSRSTPGSMPVNSAIEAGTSSVTTTAANIRSGPGTGYAVIGTLAAGTTVDLVGCEGAWCETPYGYVNARLLAAGPAAGSAGAPAGTTRVVVRPASLAPAGYADASYVDPSTPYPAATQTPAYYVGYPDETVPGGTYPIYSAAGAPTLGGAVLATLAAPVVGVAAAVATVVDGWTGGWDSPATRPALHVSGGYDTPAPRYGYGWDSIWRASWGPGYWGPGLHGANRPSYWGTRPSYWGGRPSYWNMHPGYGDTPRFGDRAGNSYWSRGGEGALPQRASFTSGLGPRGQGPYAAGPWYDGRPVVWRP